MTGGGGGGGGVRVVLLLPVDDAPAASFATSEGRTFLGIFFGMTFGMTFLICALFADETGGGTDLAGTVGVQRARVAAASTSATLRRLIGCFKCEPPESRSRSASLLLLLLLSLSLSLSLESPLLSLSLLLSVCARSDDLDCKCFFGSTRRDVDMAALVVVVCFTCLSFVSARFTPTELVTAAEGDFGVGVGNLAAGPAAATAAADTVDAAGVDAAGVDAAAVVVGWCEDGVVRGETTGTGTAGGAGTAAAAAAATAAETETSGEDRNVVDGGTSGVGSIFGSGSSVITLSSSIMWI